MLDKTILVVDDEPAVTNLVRLVLDKAGYSVLIAESAEQAARAAASHSGRIDLLITNHLLHKGTGREVAERLRVGRPDMKVMHMSGHNRDMLEAEGTLTPGSTFLHKPFTPAELRKAVNELLAK